MTPCESTSSSWAYHKILDFQARGPERLGSDWDVVTTEDHPGRTAQAQTWGICSSRKEWDDNLSKGVTSEGWLGNYYKLLKYSNY